MGAFSFKNGISLPSNNLPVYQFKLADFSNSKTQYEEYSDKSNYKGLSESKFIQNPNSLKVNVSLLKREEVRIQCKFLFAGIMFNMYYDEMKMYNTLRIRMNNNCNIIHAAIFSHSFMADEQHSVYHLISVSSSIERTQ